MKSSHDMELKIALCGDVTLGGVLPNYMRDASISDWVSDVSAAWEGADLLIGNLEGPCVTRGKPKDGHDPKLTLYAAANRLRELAAAGFSAVTLANNHIMDCGALGLIETIQGLDEAGIYHAGA